MNDSRHIVWFSGGKDSTAMLRLLLEKNIRVDEILYYETGWDRPEVRNHIDRIIEENLAPTFTILSPRKPMEYFLTTCPVKDKETDKMKPGYGWPRPHQTWCCRFGQVAMRKYERTLGHATEFIAVAFDEKAGNPDKFSCRWREVRYPLKEWGISSPEALKICKDLKYNWDGLYDRVPRARCWLCPLEQREELRRLWKLNPEKWAELKELDEKVRNPFYYSHGKEFSVEGLAAKFQSELDGLDGPDKAQFSVRHI